MKREVFYLVHVPKCAGTTVEHFAFTSLAPGEVFCPEKSWPINRFFLGKAWRRPSAIEPDQVRVICGHYFGRACGHLLTPHTPLEALLIRDPVPLFLSWYNYRMARHERFGRPVPKFKDWYKSQGRNPIARHVCTRHLGWSEAKFLVLKNSTIIEQLCSTLDSFWFIGDFRHVDRLLDAVGERLNVKQDHEIRNVTQYKFLRRAELDGGLVEQIRRENAIDGYLYGRYRDRLFDPAAVASVAEPLTGARLIRDELRRACAWARIRKRQLRARTTAALPVAVLGKG
ncbi:MAG: hypothetical protein WC807_15835 [Hyphomicrobium sp.]